MFVTFLLKGLVMMGHGYISMETNIIYNEGANFGDQLYCSQEDMIIDGKHKSLHGE